MNGTDIFMYSLIITLCLVIGWMSLDFIRWVEDEIIRYRITRNYRKLYQFPTAADKRGMKK